MKTYEEWAKTPQAIRHLERMRIVFNSARIVRIQELAAEIANGRKATRIGKGVLTWAMVKADGETPPVGARNR